MSNVYFFFFRAEDGIRDRNVTGVQTCALPICDAGDRSAVSELAVRPRRLRHSVASPGRRSEERRGGKECRSRRPPYHYKKKDFFEHQAYRIARQGSPMLKKRLLP